MAWILFLGWAVGICVLSSMTGEKVERYMWNLPHFDKVCHTVAFAIGAILLSVALRQTTRLSMGVVLPLVIVLISLFGLTDEWHQRFTPQRSGGDVWDWMADTLGATVGALASYVAKRAGNRPLPSAEIAHGDRGA